MTAEGKVKEFEKIGFVPVKRPDVSPYPMSLPFNWDVDPFEDSNWCFQLQTLRYLMVYLDAFKETKNNKYLDVLLDWFKDWWEASQVSPNKFTWHDMATGIRAEKIHKVAREIKNNKIKLPAWFVEMLLKHVSVIREKGFVRTNHNHGLYAAHGLRCLAEHLGPGMMRNVIRRSHDLVEQIIKNQFDENYVHKEHSPHYHYLVLKSLKEYKKTGFYEDLDVLSQYIEGAENVAKHLLLPDGREIPFGDTDNEILGRPVGDEVAGDVELWCRSGYVVYKNGLSYFCMTNNYNSNIHKHWDNLSFVFGTNGQDVFVDPGKYKYTADNIREKILSPESHNTINFDGYSWGGKDIVKKSISLDGEVLGDKLVLEGGLSLKVKNSVVNFNRYVECQSGFLKLTDKVVRSKSFLPSGQVGRVYSRFVLHKDAKIIDKRESEVLFDINNVVVRVEIKTIDDAGKVLKKPYLIESTPVSYSYGEYCESLSLRIYNAGVLSVLVFVE